MPADGIPAAIRLERRCRHARLERQIKRRLQEPTPIQKTFILARMSHKQSGQNQGSMSELGHSLPSPSITPGTRCPLRPVSDQIGRAARCVAMGQNQTPVPAASGSDFVRRRLRGASGRSQCAAAALAGVMYRGTAAGFLEPCFAFRRHQMPTRLTSPWAGYPSSHAAHRFLMPADRELRYEQRRELCRQYSRALRT